MITSPPLYEVKDGQLIISKLNEKKFGKDYHPEFKGYVVEKDGGIWISTIEAKHIGKGHFSALIKEFKEKYDFIKIPTPSKMMIERALHLGFSIEKEYFEEPFNEWATIMFWCRNEKENGNGK